MGCGGVLRPKRGTVVAEDAQTSLLGSVGNAPALERVEGGHINLILSRGQHSHERHVADPVNLEDRVHGDNRATISHQGPQQADVPPTIREEEVRACRGKLDRCEAVRRSYLGCLQDCAKARLLQGDNTELIDGTRGGVPARRLTVLRRLRFACHARSQIPPTGREVDSHFRAEDCVRDGETRRVQDPARRSRIKTPQLQLHSAGPLLAHNRRCRRSGRGNCLRTAGLSARVGPVHASGLGGFREAAAPSPDTQPLAGLLVLDDVPLQHVCRKLPSHGDHGRGEWAGGFLPALVGFQPRVSPIHCRSALLPWPVRLLRRVTCRLLHFAVRLCSIFHGHRCPSRRIQGAVALARMRLLGPTQAAPFRTGSRRGSEAGTALPLGLPSPTRVVPQHPVSATRRQCTTVRSTQAPQRGRRALRVCFSRQIHTPRAASARRLAKGRRYRGRPCVSIHALAMLPLVVLGSGPCPLGQAGKVVVLVRLVDLSGQYQRSAMGVEVDSPETSPSAEAYGWDARLDSPFVVLPNVELVPGRDREDVALAVECE
mmetsp:Transcript_7806/g.18685  ORF Transcript_7806/g.18685 Transcript_7806/m.18685 type:complete len:543 (-) Transcript_7806:656-2284(-)